MNRDGVQQFQALKAAESWFTGMETFLRDRLALCETIREGLNQLNGVLGGINGRQKSVSRNHPGGMPHTGIYGPGKRSNVAIRPSLDVGKINDATGTSKLADKATCADGDGNNDASKIPIIEVDIDNPYLSEYDLESPEDESQIICREKQPNVSEGNERNHGEAILVNDSGQTEEDRAAEEEELAVDRWLDVVRVTRSKWIAGGRDAERRIGFR